MRKCGARLDTEMRIFKDRAVYYAGPAKTRRALPPQLLGPTTAGRVEPYVDQFQAHGGSLVMLAKGNRAKSKRARASIGGAAARSKKVEVLEHPELGMEAIWQMEVENFPAFIVIDNEAIIFKELNLG